MSGDFEARSAKTADLVWSGNCIRCDGSIEVRHRLDQMTPGYLIHRNPVECLRQEVEGGTRVVYDVREEPPGEVAGCVMPVEKVRRRYSK